MYAAVYDQDPVSGLGNPTHPLHLVQGPQNVPPYLYSYPSVPTPLNGVPVGPDGMPLPPTSASPAVLAGGLSYPMTYYGGQQMYVGSHPLPSVVPPPLAPMTPTFARSSATVGAGSPGILPGGSSSSPFYSSPASTSSPPPGKVIFFLCSYHPLSSPR